MANLPLVPMLGPEGPPPMKKPRTESESGEKKNGGLNKGKGVWLGQWRS